MKKYLIMMFLNVIVASEKKHTHNTIEMIVHQPISVDQRVQSHEQPLRVHEGVVVPTYMQNTKETKHFCKEYLQNKPLKYCHDCLCGVFICAAVCCHLFVEM